MVVVVFEHLLGLLDYLCLILFVLLLFALIVIWC